MTYMLQFEGEYYNYRNKKQILYNQGYLDYTCIIRNIFIYFCIIFYVREYQISSIYYIDSVFSYK